MAKSSFFTRLYVLAAGCLMALYCVTEYPNFPGLRQVRGAVAQPFYLERASYERNQSGALSMYGRRITARRTDGTTAIVEYSAVDKFPTGVQFPPTRRVISLDGSAVWLLDASRVRVSWPKMTSGEARAELQLMANRDPDCGANKSHIAARESLNGHSTVVVVRDLDLVRQVKIWQRPEFGCEALQSQISVKQDGTILADTRLVNAALGEPDALLFDVGEGYQQVSMIDLLEAQLRSVGEPMSEAVRRMGINFERERKQTVPDAGPKILR
jgi:hypothetical protein